MRLYIQVRQRHRNVDISSEGKIYNDIALTFRWK